MQPQAKQLRPNSVWSGGTLWCEKQNQCSLCITKTQEKHSVVPAHQSSQLSIWQCSQNKWATWVSSDSTSKYFIIYLKCKFFNIITVIQCDNEEKYSICAIYLRKFGLLGAFREKELWIALRGIRQHIENMNDFLCANTKKICWSLDVVCATQIYDSQNTMVLNQAQMCFSKMVM